MSFPKYPAYRHSGVTWLGDIPTHWAVTPLKRDTLFVTSGARGWAENYADEGDLFLRIGNLTRNSITLDLSDIQRVAVEDGSEGARTQVRAGDVLFSITAYLGSVAVVPDGLGTAYVSQHVALARLKQTRFLPEWVAYVASSYVGKTYLETQGYGGTKVQLSLGDVANLLVTSPPLEEQRTLTWLLAHETAKIDALVEEQRSLIALLKEKRQAVISQAVTKGLNPYAPMKDSGVQWLGKVPTHWLVLPLKHVVTFKSGGTPDKNRPDYWDGDVPWASAKDLKVDSLPDTADHISEVALTEGAATLVSAGTVLVVVRGMILARTFPVVTTAVDMAINQDLKAVTARAPSRNDWLAWLLRASTAETLSRLDEAGHGTKALRMDAWGDMRVAVPPPDEQEQIASFLRSECERIDDLVSEADRAITLLAERRSSLVSAAVTGKIDVRGLVPQPEAVAA